MTLERTTPPTPVRGARPRNRRALIIAAATDLFYRHGFDRISMSDIAEAVAIGPSALYRHFSGKQDLLRAVMSEGLTPIRELLCGLDLRDETISLPEVAEVALDHRQLGVLWQREARHMTPEDYVNLRAELRGIGQLLTDRVRAARPELSAPEADLLAWSIIAVLTSTSFHRLDLPRAQYDQLLHELLGAILDTARPGNATPAPPAAAHPPGLVPSSRREALLAQAIRMFAQHGYTGVGIEDIGSTIGIAGPSIYNHFSSKRDMLITALRRGSAALFMDLTAAYRAAADATDGLRMLVRSYIHFTLQHHNIVDLMTTELEHLPEDELHAARQAQHDYIGEWVHLLRTTYPTLDPTKARIRVHAVLTVANNTARTPHLRRTSRIPGILETICTDLLRVSSE